MCHGFTTLLMLKIKDFCAFLSMFIQVWDILWVCRKLGFEGTFDKKAEKYTKFGVEDDHYESYVLCTSVLEFVWPMCWDSGKGCDK